MTIAKTTRQRKPMTAFMSNKKSIVFKTKTCNYCTIKLKIKNLFNRRLYIADMTMTHSIQSLIIHVHVFSHFQAKGLFF